MEGGRCSVEPPTGEGRPRFAGESRARGYARGLGKELSEIPLNGSLDDDGLASAPLS